MSLTNLKMKAKAPQKKGSVRGGADASYIPGIGSQPNSGQHGSASGPYRMVPSKKSPLGSGPSNKPMAHKRTEEGSQTAGMYDNASYGGMSRTRPENSGQLMERYNTEWQRSRERGECVPKDLYSKKKNPAHVMAAIKSANSAPYGRNRPADSSRSYATPGAPQITKGAGRARGVNIWYPNKGIAASGDSGDSQDSAESE